MDWHLGRPGYLDVEIIVRRADANSQGDAKLAAEMIVEHAVNSQMLMILVQE